MSREERIKEKLSALKPQKLKITNNSELHIGHSGHDGSGESHFELEIKSQMLEGLPRAQQHRKLNKLLQDEFDSGLHALSIKILD